MCWKREILIMEKGLIDIQNINANKQRGMYADNADTKPQDYIDYVIQLVSTVGLQGEILNAKIDELRVQQAKDKEEVRIYTQ